MKSETGPPARMQEEMLRVFAVFLDGFEMIVTGAESKVAQTRPAGGSAPSGLRDGPGGSAISRETSCQCMAGVTKNGVRTRIVVS